MTKLVLEAVKELHSFSDKVHPMQFEQWERLLPENERMCSEPLWDDVLLLQLKPVPAIRQHG